MIRKPMLNALALAVVTAAALSTVSFAQDAATPAAPAEAGCHMGEGMMQGGMMGGGRMQGGMMQGGMMGGMGPMAGFDFAAVDTDKDGKITEAEFTAFRAAKVAKLDANADGKLSAEELAADAVAEMTGRIQMMTAEMVKRSDVDGDGLLSAAELAARPMPAMMFARVDANSDGAVTQDEVDAMKQGMPGMQGGPDQGKGGWFSGMMGHGRGEGHGKGHGRQGGMGEGQGGMGQGGMGQGHMGQGNMGQGMMGQGNMGDCSNN